MPGECENERCREVYLYDAVSGRLVCVSCDPSGARPVGPGELGGRESVQGGARAGNFPFYLPRNLSDGGGRLFFQSSDALVPNDSNGHLNVYEWERVGEGSCSTASASYTASHEGCTFPISNVAGGSDSHFMDASTNGDNVFIATADQLLPSDTDSREDVYDVSVGGGFPVSVDCAGVRERGLLQTPCLAPAQHIRSWAQRNLLRPRQPRVTTATCGASNRNRKRRRSSVGEAR